MAVENNQIKKKHAYLIMAHNEPALLQLLIESIDDERNDIFVHIDSKSNIADFNNISACKSRLFFTERMSAYWGDLSLVKVELSLFETALNTDDYEYFHLLSGVDLPLKSQNYIHDYFDKVLSGKNVVSICTDENNKKSLLYRTRYWHIFTKISRSKNQIVKKISQKINNFFIIIQKILKVERKYPFKVFKGSEWVSLTKDFTQYLVSHREEILRTFRGVHCADEIYKQSLLLSSPYRSTIYNYSEESGSPCLRYIDWDRGRPYVWQSCDWDELLQSKNLFARKFSSSDMQFCRQLAGYVSGGKNDYS